MFSYSAIEFWNPFSKVITDAESLTSFKTELKQFFAIQLYLMILIRRVILT